MRVSSISPRFPNMKKAGLRPNRLSDAEVRAKLEKSIGTKDVKQEDHRSKVRDALADGSVPFTPKEKQALQAILGKS